MIEEAIKYLDNAFEEDIDNNGNYSIVLVTGPDLETIERGTIDFNVKGALYT